MRRPPWRGFDLVERQAVDVDQVLWGLDLQLHQVQQIGAAGDEPGAGRAHCRRGSFGWRCAR
jgi:hypothetical protein